MLPKRQLGTLLVERGLISTAQLLEALEIQEKAGGRIGSLLVKLGYITEENLLHFLSLFYDVPQIDLRHAVIDPKALELMSGVLVHRCLVLPVKFVERPPDRPVLIIATPDPTNVEAVEIARQATGCQLEPFVCSFGMFETLYAKYYPQSAEADEIHVLLDNYDGKTIALGLVRVLIEKKLLSNEELNCAIRSCDQDA